MDDNGLSEVTRLGKTVINFWLFSVSVADLTISFLIVPAGEEKPKLQEVGPYAYRQTLTKEDVKFREVGSLLALIYYTHNKYYIYVNYSTALLFLLN